MFFNNSDNDPYGDLRRREEYERQQQTNFARGIGNFLYRYIVYSLIWLSTTMLITITIVALSDTKTTPATLLGMVASLFIFKLQYIKDYPIKSLLTICFIFGLVSLAFY